MVRRVVEIWEWFAPSFGSPLISAERVRVVGRIALLVLPAVALFVVFLITGLRGIDFGYHWDEADGMIAPARRMLESGILLPRESTYSYNYPGLTRFMVLWPALPAGFRAWLGGLEPQRIQAAMLTVLDAPGFLLTLRRMFFATSALGIVWIYGAALALGLRWWTALVAAGGLALSWEYSYHSRFVATDCVLTQFAALSLLMLALHHRTGRCAWLSASAAAAGLAMGTKYTGSLLMIPILLAGTLDASPQRVVARVLRAARLCAIACGVYLATTPGMLLDPFRFLTDARFISTYYSVSSHGGYSVASGAEHARIAFEFLALDYFSPFRALSMLAFAGVLAGAFLWFRRDWRFGIVLVALPLAFFPFFCAKYRLAFVRNYLFLAPFLALMLARAVEELAARASHPAARAILSLAFAGAAAVQGTWLLRAGESIRKVSPKRYVRDALVYVAEHPRTRFRLSSRVLSLADELHVSLPKNALRSGAADEVVFFASAEGPGPWSWKTNDPWLTRAVFGPREVNFHWYSSWAGHDRVVVMTFQKAHDGQIPLAN